MNKVLLFLYFPIVFFIGCASAPSSNHIVLSDLNQDFICVQNDRRFDGIMDSVSYTITGKPKYDDIFKASAKIKATVRQLNFALEESRKALSVEGTLSAIAGGTFTTIADMEALIARDKINSAQCRMLFPITTINFAIKAPALITQEAKTLINELIQLNPKSDFSGTDALKIPAVLRGIASSESDLNYALKRVDGIVNNVKAITKLIFKNDMSITSEGSINDSTPAGSADRINFPSHSQSISDSIGKESPKYSLKGNGPESDEYSTSKIKSANSFGDLVIVAPGCDGSKVYLNGIFKGITPLTLKHLSTGKYAVVVRVLDYVGEKTVFITPDDLIRFDVPLKLGKGTLKVFSNPLDANMKIDDLDMGITPKKINDLEAGIHEINLTLPGYFAKSDIINIHTDSTLTYECKLEPCSYLFITGLPQGATIMLNSKPSAIKKNFIYEANPGKTNLLVRADGFRNYEESFDLTPGIEKKVLVKMQALIGRLSVISVPPGASVFIDGKSVGVTPFQAGFKEGNIKVQVNYPGMDSIEQIIIMRANETNMINLQLVPSNKTLGTKQ